MADIQIPNTEARISTSMYLEAILKDDGGNEAGRSVIGAVEEFRERNPRDTNPRYQFDADRPGDIVERVPNLVDRIINIKRAVLNVTDLIQALGTADMADLIDMYKPFGLVKKEKYPPKFGGGIKTTIFDGCWLHNNPKAYSLGTDLKIIQDAEIGYTRRRPSTHNNDKGLAEKIDEQ